jgi:hypothetical protein
MKPMSFRTVCARIRAWFARQFDLHPSEAYERPAELEPLLRSYRTADDTKEEDAR